MRVSRRDFVIACTAGSALAVLAGCSNSRGRGWYPALSVGAAEQSAGGRTLPSRYGEPEPDSIPQRWLGRY